LLLLLHVQAAAAAVCLLPLKLCHWPPLCRLLLLPLPLQAAAVTLALAGLKSERGSCCLSGCAVNLISCCFCICLLLW
jgi:hypothetical protein